MNGYQDPRRGKYFVATAKGEYHGVRTGITPTSSYADSEDLSRVNCTNNDNIMWMTPAEAWFLRAEYELRWGCSSDAATYYAEGIRTSVYDARRQRSRRLHRRQGADARQLLPTWSPAATRIKARSPRFPSAGKRAATSRPISNRSSPRSIWPCLPEGREAVGRSSAARVMPPHPAGPRQQQRRQDQHHPADPPSELPLDGVP